MKVQSHIGVQGNEQADPLANAAAELMTEGKLVDRDAHVAQRHCENFDNKFWPQTKKTADSEDQQSNGGTLGTEALSILSSMISSVCLM